jgi:hypothetical protein
MVPHCLAHQDILGSPREEDDNVPDDFKVGDVDGALRCACWQRRLVDKIQFNGSIAEATMPMRMQFVRKAYSILTI